MITGERSWDEIKFRCFTGDGEKMEYDVFPVTDRVLIKRTAHGENYEVTWVECDEVMQWTGTYDANGKEVYEGDIAKLEDHTAYYVCIWDKKRCAFIWQCAVADQRRMLTEPSTVVGNVHENGDLIDYEIYDVEA